MNSSKKDTKSRKKIVTIIILFVVGIIATIVFSFIQRAVYPKCVAEIGTEILPSDFVRYEIGEASFSEDSSVFDTKTLGEYDVKIKMFIFEFSSKLYIIDSTPPTASPKDLLWFTEKEILPEYCVENVLDATELTYSFDHQIDMNSFEIQDISVSIEDVGGNITKVNSTIRYVPLRERFLIEAGSEIPSKEVFYKNNIYEMECLTDMSVIDSNIVGENIIQFSKEGLIIDCVLEIEDTISPIAEVIERIDGFRMKQYEAENFVRNIVDETDVTVTFITEIDYQSDELQVIKLQLTDAGGNFVEGESTIILREDTNAPEIYAPDLIRCTLGENVLYRGNISVIDNCDEDVSFTIDNSLVDINQEGIYKIICTATDTSGNITTKEMMVEIHKVEHTDEEVHQLADKLLSEITNESMSPREKAEIIWHWCNSNIIYRAHFVKEDWIQGAYSGLHNRQGDCYTYAATAKELLTRAGIKNMDIKKIPAKSQHFWNLIDLGDGWYHFDTSYRLDDTTIFIWTDEELMEYSNSHNLSHNYDKTKYPIIN